MAVTATMAIDASDPHDVGRALVAITDQANRAYAEAEALRLLLLGLVMSLGSHRRSPFVAHSEIELALIRTKEAASGGADCIRVAELADSFLALYREELPLEDTQVRPPLRLVRTDEARPAVTGDDVQITDATESKASI